MEQVFDLILPLAIRYKEVRTSIEIRSVISSFICKVVLTGQSVKPFEFDAAQSRTEVADTLWNMIGASHGL